MTSDVSRDQSPLLRRCLAPLLDVLGQRDETRFVHKGMDESPMSLAHFLNAMASRRFVGQETTLCTTNIDPRMCPCLFIDGASDPWVIVSASDKELTVFDPRDQTHKSRPRDTVPGQLFVFRHMVPEDASLADPRSNWLGGLTRRFGTAIWMGLFLSLILAVLGIVGPMLVMVIYDRMSVPTAEPGIGWLWGGIALYLAAMFGFRSIRSRLSLYVGNRVGFLTGNEVLRRILRLPAAQTENVPIGSQIARIRDFESLRDFFTGPAAIALMETPFILLLLAVMFALAGAVAWISVGAVLTFFALAMFLEPALRRVSLQGAGSANRKNDLVFMALNNLGTIRRSGTEEVWRAKYRQLSGDAAMDGVRAATISAVFASVSNGLVALAGGGTMLLGVMRVLDGRLTVPQLIAASMICWRVLAPLRTGFGIALQLDRIRRSAAQINRLMALPLEESAIPGRASIRAVDGNVRLASVSHRYAPDAQPALLNVDLALSPGDVVVLFGHAGSGRSTILKAVMGLIYPQAGRVLHGTHNIRQLDVGQLRKGIAYSADNNVFLRVSIRENLRAAHPKASDLELSRALGEWGLRDFIASLPKGIDTVMGDDFYASVSPSFLKRLNLARAFLRPSPLVLLDDPTRYLGPESVARLIQNVRAMDRQSSVMIATQDPRLMNLADRVLWLDNGQTRFYGPSSEFRRKYAAEVASREGVAS